MKISKKDLEKRIIDAHHQGELDTIRNVQSQNERYWKDGTLNLYLDNLKSHVIFEYRKKK